MAIVTRTWQVPAFDGIDLKGTGVLHVSQGPETSLIVDADPETIDKIVAEVEGNTLVIRFKWLDALLAFKPLGPIDFRITAPNLRAVKITGAGTLIGETELRTDRLYMSVSGSGKVLLELQADELRANVSGSGDFQLRGNVVRQEVTISGSGDYMAGALSSKQSDITITGSGRAQMRASERLDVTISGSGTVEYTGSAAVSQRTSGSGSIVQRPDFAPPAAAQAPRDEAQPEQTPEPVREAAAESASAAAPESASVPTDAAEAGPEA
jgi:hypothetical protein